MKWPSVVAIGDTHHRWCSEEQLRRVYEIIEETRPKFVIQVGDLYDHYNFGRFPRSLDLITPADEIRESQLEAERMWKEIRSIVPRGTKLVQLRGNHDVRIEKRVAEKFPEILWLLREKGYQDLWSFPGVKTVWDPSEPYWILPGELFAHHGHWLSSRAPGVRVKRTLYSCIVGHTHHGGVTLLPRNKFEKNLPGASRLPLFEMNCGALATSDALPMSYTELKQPDGVVHGVGVIDKWGPRFVAF